MKESYGKIFSEFYDAQYCHKNYESEIDFLKTLLNANGITSGSSLLELACGTGKHANLLCRAGYKVLATDRSEHMIKVAKENVGQSMNLQFSAMDMMEVDRIENKFDVVYSLFDSLGYLVSTDHVRDVLRKTNGLLRTDGLLICEVWNGYAFIKNHEPVRTKKFDVKGLVYSRKSETLVNFEKQTATVNFTIYHPDGTIVSTENHTNRFFFPEELFLMMTDSGYRDIKIFPSFGEGNTIDDQVFHLMVTAKR